MREQLLRGVGRALFWGSSLPMFYGGFRLYRQVWTYLKHGHWFGLSMYDFLAGIESIEAQPMLSPPTSGVRLWLLEPHSWLGLHDIVVSFLRFVSEPVFFAGISALLLAGVMALRFVAEAAEAI